VLRNLTTLPRIALPVNPRSRTFCGARIKTGGTSTPVFAAEPPRGRPGRAAFFRVHKIPGKKPLLKDHQVLRLTRNPSGSCVPEYKSRGRDQFAIHAYSIRCLRFGKRFSFCRPPPPAPVPQEIVAFSRRHSRQQLQPELHLPRRRRSAVDCPRRSRHARTGEHDQEGRIKVGPVQQIEDLRAKLKAQLLTDPSVLQRSPRWRGPDR